MSIPEDSIGAAVTGATTSALTGGVGFLDGLGNAIHELEVDVATSGDLHFDLPELAAFYNALSDVHEQLQTEMHALSARTASVAGKPAGGSVSGVQAAWAAIQDSMGSNGSMTSLTANMRDVDNQILIFMSNIQGCVNTYAAQENYAVEAIGSAGASGGGGGGGVTVPTPKPLDASSIAHVHF